MFSWIEKKITCEFYTHFILCKMFIKLFYSKVHYDLHYKKSKKKMSNENYQYQLLKTYICNVVIFKKNIIDMY